MNGRILGIKKSTLINGAFYLSTVMFCFSTIYFIFFSNLKDLWFFAFCIESGFCIFLKGFLLRIDSLNFFGVFLISIGNFYVYCLFLNIISFYIVFIFLSLSLASLLNFWIFKNKIHIKSYIFFLLTSFFIFFYILNVIPFGFFVAILCFSVVIFILSIVA